MIVQKVTRSEIFEQKIYSRSLEQAQLNEQRTNPNHPSAHDRPIMQVEKQDWKRLEDYKNQQDQTEQTEQLKRKSDMSRTNLSRINGQLEESTNLFTRHGKYDSRYTPEHIENFGSRPTYYHYSPTSTRITAEYKPAPAISHTSNRHIVPLHPTHPPPNFPNNNPPYRLPQTHSLQVYNNPSQYATQTNTVKDKDEEFYDLTQPKDAFRYHAHEAKQQAKENVRENVKAAVGTQNYYLLKDMKDAAVHLKDNAKEAAKENIQDVVYNVANTAQAAKNVVVEGAHQAKEQIKQTTKQAVKGAVGEQNFNLMKYIKDAAGQLKTNMIGPSPKEKRKQNDSLQSAAIKPEQFNQVSPLQYSQRSFSQVPEEFAFFWVYGLVAVGFFLVIFQALK